MVTSKHRATLTLLALVTACSSTELLDDPVASDGASGDGASGAGPKNESAQTGGDGARGAVPKDENVQTGGEGGAHAGGGGAGPATPEITPLVVPDTLFGIGPLPRRILTATTIALVGHGSFAYVRLRKAVWKARSTSGISSARCPDARRRGSALSTERRRASPGDVSLRLG